MGLTGKGLPHLLWPAFLEWKLLLQNSSSLRQHGFSLGRTVHQAACLPATRWELGPADENAWLDLAPAGVPFYDGGDWWGTKITIPEDAFEMNFIFSDAEGTYENNGGNDFMLNVAGGLTVEQWEEVC